MIVSVPALFAAAGIEQHKTVPWGTKIEERGPGVYVVSLAGSDCPPLEHLPEIERTQWVDGQTIVYVGRSKHLRRRLVEFYRHVHGQPRPHRGGQAVLLLNCPLVVSWSGVTDYVGAEDAMIEAFKAAAKVKPFANRVRASRLRTI